MDDEDFKKLQRVQQAILEQFVNLAGSVAELEASVSVLKLYVATQTSPGDPAPALKVLREMEKKLLESSPQEQARLQSAEMIQTLKEWKKRGGGSHEA